MIMQVLAVKDMQAEAFMRPMFVSAVGLGLRAFQDEVNRVAPDNPMSAHPEDFYLFHLGSFDDAFGRFSLFDVPVQLASAKNVADGVKEAARPVRAVS